MRKTRGRPKQSEIAVLISEGINSESRIQCKICKRTFPRMKNLNTHIATHSDEKKYRCTFPDCTKCFKQSSQLKNHLLLHSKEKPFICPADGCLARYTHSSRICSFHSSLKVIKQLETTEEIRCRFYKNVENISEADKIWFEEYLSKRKKTSPASVKKRKIDVENLQEIHEEGMKISDNEDSIMKSCLARYTYSGGIYSSHTSLKLRKLLETTEEIRNRFYKNLGNLTETDKIWFEDCISKRERQSPPASLKKQKIDDVENLQEMHQDGMKISDSEDSIMKSDNEDSIMKSDNEDSIMKSSDDESNIMKSSDNEESIMKSSDDESIMKSSDDESNIIKNSDNENSIMEMVDRPDSIKKNVGDEDIQEDGTMKVNGNKEEMNQKEMLQELQDGALFFSFLKNLWEKNERDSKALFETAIKMKST